MIIEELIQQLQRYPKNSRVIVQGYEDGFDEVTTVKEISIKPNTSHEWYMENILKAILLYRKPQL